MSLGFWSCLLTSAALYAIVTLTPGIVVKRQLTSQLISDAAEVRRLADQVDRYEEYGRRRRSLSTPFPQASHPAHAARVDETLQFRLDLEASDSGSQTAAPQMPFPVRVIVGSPVVRWGLLAAATGLLLYAFTMLTESESAAESDPRRLIASSRKPRSDFLKRRYRPRAASGSQ